MDKLEKNLRSTAKEADIDLDKILTSLEGAGQQLEKEVEEEWPTAQSFLTLLNQYLQAYDNAVRNKVSQNEIDELDRGYNDRLRKLYERITNETLVVDPKTKRLPTLADLALKLGLVWNKVTKLWEQPKKKE